MRKQQSLCEHAAGGKNGDAKPPTLPADKRRRNIGINFTLQFAATESLLPDFSLQCFQRIDLAVASDQPSNIPGSTDDNLLVASLGPAWRAIRTIQFASFA